MNNIFIANGLRVLYRRRLLITLVAVFVLCVLLVMTWLRRQSPPQADATAAPKQEAPGPQWEPPPGSSTPTCRGRGDEGWRPLVLAPHSLHLYSAFYDPLSADGPILRVLGLAPLVQKQGQVALVCRVRTPLTSAVTAIPASLLIIPEHHSNEYTAVYIICKLPQRDLRPQTVAIAETAQSPVLVRLRVIYPRPEFEGRQNITLCFPVIFDFFDEQLLVERLELARLLGAERVVAYCHSVSSGVRRVMDFYITQGFLEVLPWNVPPLHVHYMGQMVAINDCLYRNFLSSKYTMFYDLDEVIVPTRGRNWTQLIQDLNFDKSTASALQFRMTYFHGQDWGDLNLDDRGRVSSLGLKSLHTILKEGYVYPYDVRAKTMVVPARVETMGIHFPQTLRVGATGMVQVSDGEALVHHYRFGGSGSNIRDPSILHLAPALIARAQQSWNYLTLRRIASNSTLP